MENKKATILIADADAQARNILEQILLGQGYTVIAANDGYSAKDKILETKPDLIILDNYMPGPSGNELCRMIKANPETRLIPVVMLTGYTETPEKLESIEAGAEGFSQPTLRDPHPCLQRRDRPHIGEKVTHIQALGLLEQL
jgi:CheY-like chemotaxis protein